VAVEVEYENGVEEIEGEQGQELEWALEQKLELQRKVEHGVEWKEQEWRQLQREVENEVEWKEQDWRQDVKLVVEKLNGMQLHRPFQHCHV
jgi:hypothetical protein